MNNRGTRRVYLIVTNSLMIMNKKKLSLTLLATALLAMAATPADACTGITLKSDACTGITLKSKDGQTVVARTIEWGGSDLNSQYVIVPRGYKQQSFLPGGATDGMTFTARHGYVACPPVCSTSLPMANMRATTLRKKRPPLPTCNWRPTSWANAPRLKR